TANPGEKDFRFDRHDVPCLKRNIVLWRNHRDLIEFEPDTVCNKLHLIVADSHESRSVGRFGDTFQNLNIEFSRNDAGTQAFLNPGVQFQYVLMGIAKLRRQRTERKNARPVGDVSGVSSDHVDNHGLTALKFLRSTHRGNCGVSSAYSHRSVKRVWVCRSIAE